MDGTTGTASAIAAGQSRSCAIQAESGIVICWPPIWPVSVEGATSRASAIAVGSNHGCAIRAEADKVVCWGSDRHGQATPPPSVDGTSGTASAITAGHDYSCAIQAETGGVVCWGRDGPWSTPPPSVDGTAGTAIAVAAGGSHTLAIQGPPPPPLLVVLESFTAEVTRRGVLLKWTTATELDNAGFRVLRVKSEPGHRRSEEVVPLGFVPAKGSDLAGAKYEYLDSPPWGVSVTYYLEDIDLFGKITRHGPVTVELGGPGWRRTR